MQGLGFRAYRDLGLGEFSPKSSVEPGVYISLVPANHQIFLLDPLGECHPKFESLSQKARAKVLVVLTVRG